MKQKIIAAIVSWYSSQPAGEELSPADIADIVLKVVRENLPKEKNINANDLVSYDLIKNRGFNKCLNSIKDLVK